MTTATAQKDGDAYGLLRRPHRPSPYQLTYVNGELALRCPFEDKDLAKRIDGARWHKETKTWRYPARPEVLAEIEGAFPGLIIPAEVIEAVEAVERAEAAVAALKDDRGQKPIVPMPLREGVKPYWHQITAFNIVMTLFGCESNG